MKARTLACGIWALALGLHLLGSWITARKIRRASRMQAPHRPRPISVIKPICGMDSGLRENLESFFSIDYPEFELLFCSRQANDLACALVRRLIAAHPQVNARLLIQDVEIGPNPKINNMITAYDQARYERILISDSNVRVGPSYLHWMGAALTDDVGMVTSPVSGRGGLGIGGRLESAFLNTFYVRSMTLAFWIGHPCVIGKSMLFRRSTLTQIGGMSALSPYLAEDYVAGQRVAQLGLRVVATDSPVHQHVGKHSVAAFWLRHLRWGRLRKVQAPGLFLIELWFGSVISGALGVYGLAHPTGLSATVFLAAHFTLWAACDLALMRRMGQPASPKNLLAWCLRELTHPVLWAQIASSNEVLWRGQKLILSWGGRLAPLHPLPSEAAPIQPALHPEEEEAA